ncbi:MAG: GFA family protein [Cellvibrionaceae bacterium]
MVNGQRKREQKGKGEIEGEWTRNPSAAMQEGELAMITGGCRCGEIEYSCAKPPSYVGNCHCLDCQKFTGAPFVNWATFKRGDFALTQGQPKEVSCTQGVHRGFCGDCGTQLYWRKDDQPVWIDITVGSLDNPLPYEPQGEAFVSRKLPWVRLNDALPHYQLAPFEPGVRGDD